MNSISKVKAEAIRKHRVAYRRLSKSLTGRVGLSGWIHDIDKVLLLRLGLRPELVSRLHRSYSLHHKGSGFMMKKAAAIDWECARFTKPEKPLNAKETWRKYYPDYNFSRVLRRLKL